MYYQVNLPAGEKHHDPDIGDLVGGHVVEVNDAVAETKSYLEKTRRRSPRLPEVASPEATPKVAPEVASSEASPPTSKPSKSRRRRRKKDA